MRKDTQEAFAKLQSQLRTLIVRYEEAVYNMEKDHSELKRVREDLNNAKNKIKEQEKIIEHYELKTALLSREDDKAMARKRVMAMIHDIDKCISLLNN